MNSFCNRSLWVSCLGLWAAATVTLPVRAEFREVRLAQARDVSALSFTSNSGVQFQIQLQQAIATPPLERQTLDSKVFGPIQLSSGGGYRSIESYEWSVEPQSQLYLSPSGYQALAAQYRYRQGADTYRLRIYCQTVRLQGQSSCMLSGNGPLLAEDVSAVGDLAVGTQAWAQAEGETGRIDLPQDEGIDLTAVRFLPAKTSADPALTTAIQAADTKETTQYLYNQVDLNKDGQPEALVYLSDSAGCRPAGCDLLIFQPEGDRYQEIARLQDVKNPIIVSDATTWGWRNLIIYGSGKSRLAQRYHLVRHDGESYPRNPAAEPFLKRPAAVRGVAVLADSAEEPVVDRPGRRPVFQQRAYRRGYELGQLDAKQKLSADYRRHSTEFNERNQARFEEGYTNGYQNLAGADDSPDAPGKGDRFTGRGTLYEYPNDASATEKRYDITEIQLVPGQANQSELRLSTKDRTIILKGKLESKDQGQTLNLAVVEGLPAQGVVFISSTGLVRTEQPIFVGANDQEISVYFRPE